MRNPELIDRLGRLKARIAELVDVEHEIVFKIKNQLAAAGQRQQEGKLFRGVLSVFERTAVDTDVVRKLYPEALFPELYTSRLIERLDISARTAEVLEAA